MLHEYETCNYADDTLFVCYESLEMVVSKLEHDSYFAICWFERNSMKPNTDKCHLLITGNKHEQLWVKIGKTKFGTYNNTVKRLGVIIDRPIKT